jgi:hypothetical protein
MDPHERAEKRAAAQDRKYRERYRPKRVGQSVFTIQQVQAERAAKVREARTGAKRPRSSFPALPSCASAISGSQRLPRPADRPQF